MPIKENTIRNDVQRISRTLTKDRPYVSKEERNAWNNVLQYLNHQNSEALRSNKIATKLIIHTVINKVLFDDKTGVEAFGEVEQRIKEPLDAIFESIEKELPFIELNKLLDKQQYRHLFEVKEVKYIFPDQEKREEHNKKILSKSIDKLKNCFTKDNENFRQSIEKRVSELIAKYNH